MPPYPTFRRDANVLGVTALFFSIGESANG
jgi:hypothetical protein